MGRSFNIYNGNPCIGDMVSSYALNSLWPSGVLWHRGTWSPWLRITVRGLSGTTPLPSGDMFSIVYLWTISVKFESTYKNVFIKNIIQNFVGRILICFACTSLWCSFLTWTRVYSLSGRTSYRKISWSLEAARFSLDFSNRSWIWQTPGQQRCRDACQISERRDRYNIQSRGFETSQDLAVRRPSA